MGLAGIDAGGAGEAGATAGLVGLTAGAGEVVAAGGVVAVCASAPETIIGSAASAPANKTRSVMRQDPTRGETPIMRVPNGFTMHIKVTNLSPPAKYRGVGARFSPITTLARQMQKAAPRGGL